MSPCEHDKSPCQAPLTSHKMAHLPILSLKLLLSDTGNGSSRGTKSKGYQEIKGKWREIIKEKGKKLLVPRDIRSHKSLLLARHGGSRRFDIFQESRFCPCPTGICLLVELVHLLLGKQLLKFPEYAIVRKTEVNDDETR